jgi:UDP-N-acetylglucosamine--N-acetylmuramyl-(pentapeptide) pyrophosphoryl-undecaprenol N-acetylglucosamine transferase
MTAAARAYGRPHAVEDLAALVLTTAGLVETGATGAAATQAPETRSAAA